jgi:hypothetical protein
VTERGRLAVLELAEDCPWMARTPRKALKNGEIMPFCVDLEKTDFGDIVGVEIGIQPGRDGNRGRSVRRMKRLQGADARRDVTRVEGKLFAVGCADGVGADPDPGPA